MSIYPANTIVFVIYSNYSWYESYSRPQKHRMRFYSFNTMNWLMINTVVLCGKRTNETEDETTGPHGSGDTTCPVNS